MILTHLSTAMRAFRASLIAAIALLGFSAAKAQNFFDNTISGVNLGNASGGTTGIHKTWAIFALSGNVNITDATQNPTNHPDVLGDIGMAGAGNLSMSLSRVKGSVYQDTGAYNGGGTITGSVFTNQGVAYLNQAVTDANIAAVTASNLARATGAGASQLTISGGISPSVLTGDSSGIALRGISGQIGAIGGPSAAAGQTYVLNLTDLILSGTGAILSLTGTASTNYVINVNRYLALSSGAQIALSGGLTPQNVLINLTPSIAYDVSMSGGSTINGIILATNRNVKLTGNSIVNGEVIAKAVSLSGSSQIINPLVSP